MIFSKRKNKSGYIDRNGREIAVKYEDVFSFSDGMWGVQRIINGKDRYGLINAKGEEIIKPIYENIREFKNGYAFIINKGKIGIIDKVGNIKWIGKYQFIEEEYNG